MEINNLRTKQNISLNEYITNKETQYFVERAFQKAIEACINIGNHIISVNHLGIPGSFSDIFKILGREKIIPLELSEKFIYIVKFRNKLVHLYWEIEPEEVYSYLQKDVIDLEDFYNIITDLLKKAIT